MGTDGRVLFATESSKLCSEHFKPDDFDRTGQILVFNFPCHLQE